jgi:hypothetical protein
MSRAGFDELIGQAAISETVTDELADMRQEITRDVAATLMFGAHPASADRRELELERAAFYLETLSTQPLCRGDTPAHLTRIAEDPSDIDGALHFGCLLSLAQELEGAMWWWQFAAGAGNATAAYCLYLLHLSRGDCGMPSTGFARPLLPAEGSTSSRPPSGPTSRRPRTPPSSGRR